MIDLLKEGETLYLNYDSGIICRLSPMQPGTKDCYTHYLYLDKKTGFFFQFDKRSQKTQHIDIHSVKDILMDLEKEQREVKNFLIGET